jgi:DNA invertase Pin-like site-specific DNA recombinase
MSEQRLVAYYRVSTAQQEKSGLGLEGQRLAVRRYIETCSGALIGEFTEVKSGRLDDRAQFHKALWLCRVYDAKLVVAHLDRMSRSFALIAGLMESGVDFVAVNMPYANRFTIHVFAAVAEYELNLMSERHKAACAAAKARGRKLGNPLFSTLRRPPEVIEATNRENRERANARAREFAPLLCALRDQGATLKGIAEQLTLMGIPTPRNAQSWSIDSVRRIFERTGEQKPKSAQGRRRNGKSPLVNPSVPMFLGSLNGLQL